MLWKKSLVLVAALVLGLAPESALANAESWWSADFSLGNSVGIGTFYSSRTSSQWTSSLTISPSVTLPFPDAWPKVAINADFEAVVWWLNSFDTSAYDVNHRIQFPDLMFEIAAAKIHEFERAGITLSAGIPFIIPVSAPSRAFNRVFSIGLSAGATWKHPIGLRVAFVPKATAWIHSGESRTIPCNDAPREGDFTASFPNSQNADLAADQFMTALSIYRDEESEGGGECLIAGRQNIWVLKLPIGVAFATESHKVFVGVSYYWNFLRPLEYRPDLSSPLSHQEAFTQVMLSKVAYSYKLPISFDLAVTGGIINYLGVFSKSGNLNFPLFDIETPLKNQTQIFVEMTASL